MQSLPVMNIKPLLVLPIKKESVIHFVLMKSVISIYNIFPLLMIIPLGFSISWKLWDIKHYYLDAGYVSFSIDRQLC
jgi:hypothetical protein